MSEYEELVLKSRIEVLKGMHQIILNADDESIYYNLWIIEGIPDEPSEDDFEFIAKDKDLYNETVQVFKKCMLEF